MVPEYDGFGRDGRVSPCRNKDYGQNGGMVPPFWSCVNGVVCSQLGMSLTLAMVRAYFSAANHTSWSSEPLFMNNIRM